MINNLKKSVLATTLIAVVIVAGVIVWHQLYQSEEPVTGPISVTDDLDRNVTITEYPPKRIVSLAPSCTEVLFALDLGNKIVGVDEYSDYPPEVPEKVASGELPTVGSFAELSVETIVSLNPDIIFATGGVQGAIVENLEGFGQTVIVLQPNDFEGVISDITLAGKATGQIHEAETLVSEIRNRAQEIEEKLTNAPRPRVYVEVFCNGGYWTFGSEIFANELIYMAGGTNVFSEVSGRHITTSTEEVLQANPEIIIISKGSMAESCGLTAQTIRERAEWNPISAVQSDKIYEIDEAIIVRGTPRIIEGIEGLAKLIHPEIFG